MTHESQGWLAISTEGFAAMNAARPPEHLIKELLQNSLDSFAEGAAGEIRLRYGHCDGAFLVVCEDNGSGIASLDDLRVVYLTHKTDSHRKRGRFGRGFKEALCIAEQATVVSGGERLEFLQEDGRRVTRRSSEPAGDSIAGAGTLVIMRMPWPEAIAAELDAYFAGFLVPEGVHLEVNGRVIAPRPIALRIEASLPTEIYDAGSQSWRKPSRRTSLQLVPAAPGETPTIHEMGIPVAPVEWGVPYHCDIQQRVPMNPNRDAVQAGYALKLHVACLPALLERMDADTIKQDWVGNAARRCEETVQRRIIEQAFGTNIARSVPRRGERHFDEDARDLGVEIINTAQTSGGFRELIRAHVPSAQDVVRHDEQQKAQQAHASSFVPDLPLPQEDSRADWIRRQGGERHVRACLDFAVWFCQQLVNTCPGRQASVTGRLTLNPAGNRSLYAHWSSDNVLTLALDQSCFWQAPLGPESMMVLIHEAAHAMNMHHGLEFRREVERLAGEAASLMLHRSHEIRSRFAALVDLSVSCIA